MIKQFLQNLFLSLCILSAFTCSATNYYVDQNSLGGNCNNNNSGTLTQPFCNMDAITSMIGQLNPGDTIFIRTGTYPFVSINYLNGANGNNIVFINYDGEQPVFDATHPNSTSNEHSFRLINCTYIEVNGLEMINAYGLYGSSIRLNDSDNNRIINNHVHNNKQGNNLTWTSGIQLSNSSYNLVQNNLVHDNNWVGILTSSSNTNPSQKSVNNQYLNNLVYNHSGMGQHSDGIGFNGAYTSNCIISYNVVYNNEDDGIDTWATNSHTITHNIVYNSGLNGVGDGNGFKLGGTDQGVTPGGHFVAYNISYNNSSDGYDMNGSGGSFLYNNIAYGNGASGMVDVWRGAGQFGLNELRNNIFMNNSQSNIRVNNQYVAGLDYNIYYQTNAAPLVNYNGTNYFNLSNYQAASGMDGNSFQVDPQFVNISNYDFHLMAGSPAIDAGDPLNPGGEPIVGLSSDIGVYEYGLQITLADAHIITSANCIEVVPNPHTDLVVVNGIFNNFTIQLLDANGNLINDYTNSNPPLLIDYNSLSAGIYFIRIIHNQNSDVSLIQMINI